MKLKLYYYKTKPLCAIIKVFLENDEDTITIPETSYLNGNKYDVDKINYEAFDSCENLRVLNLPYTLKRIPTATRNNVFEKCVNLEEINVDNRNEKFISIDGVLFGNNGGSLIAYPAASKRVHYEIPEGTRSIYSKAFCGCKNLQSIRFPKSLVSLLESSFCHCPSLVNIDIHPSNRKLVIRNGCLCSDYGRHIFYIPNNVDTLMIDDRTEEIEYCALCQRDIKNIIVSEVNTNKDKVSMYGWFSPDDKGLDDVVPQCVGCESLPQSCTMFASDNIFSKFESPCWNFIKERKSLDDLPTISYFIGEEQVKCTPQIAGEKIIPFTPDVPEGHSFSGWSNLPEIMPDADLFIYGDFKVNSYKLSFYVDGQIYKELELKFNETIPNISEPEKAGHSFVGWDHTIPERMPSGDLRIVGRMRVNKYSITYYIREQIYAKQKVDYGEAVKPIECPNKSFWINIPDIMPAEDIAVPLAKDTDKFFPATVRPEDYRNLWVDEFGVNYSNDGKRLIYYNGPLQNYKIKEGTVTLCNYAFAGCTSLISVEIPKSVALIGERVFNCCLKLGSIHLPESLISIGACSFCGCPSLKYFSGKFASEDHRCIIIDGKLVCFAPADLTEYVIPSSVTSIGDFAFFNCRKITKVYIPNSVTTIGFRAFKNCSSLLSVEIDNSVTTIEESAFEDCSSLISVYITDLAAWCKINFKGEKANPLCYAHNLFINHDKIINLEIPSSVTTIGRHAFFGCSSLLSVKIGNSVTTIEESAFEDCSSLTSVYITDLAAWCKINFKGIRSNPLVYAHNLYINQEIVTYLDIPNTIVTIGENAFAECYNLITVKIPTSITSIGSYAFSGCRNLNSVDIPDGVTQIGSSAFAGCSNLTSINIPNIVAEISEGAFSGCCSLTSINIPNSVTEICSSAFAGCNSLASVKIPDSVTTLGLYIFSKCSSLTSVEIGKSITMIDKTAFKDCSRLTSVYITDMAAWCKIKFKSKDENPLFYAHNLFLNRKLVTNLEIPVSVESIGDFTFAGFYNLRSVKIPTSIKSIGWSAFSDCRSLVSVKIPKSVTSIGGSAFSGCISLTTLEIPNSVTSIGNCAFSDCRSLYSVKIPDSVTTIGSFAFLGCSGLRTVELPNSITKIGEFVFEVCENIKQIIIPTKTTDKFTRLLRSLSYDYSNKLIER